MISKFLNICCWNVKSLFNRVNEIHTNKLDDPLFLQRLKSEIIILTETHASKKDILSVCSRFYQWYQWYTNIVQGSTNGTIGNTNGTIGNTIGTNGNANGTIGPPSGTIGTNGKPMVPMATNGNIGKISNGTIGRTLNAR